MESCFQAWSSNKKICATLSFTDNIHWIMFSFQAQSQNKKHFLFKCMIIAVKTICMEGCFQARPSNKDFSSAIFVVSNIDGSITKYFLSKRRSPLQLDMSVWTVWKFHLQSVHKTILVQLISYWNHIYFRNVSQVQRAILNNEPKSSNKMSFHPKCTPRLGTFSFQEIYNNNKRKSENMISCMQ